jgi:hypothetical protein
MAHFLTGVRNNGPKTSPQGPSVDQVIAQRIGPRTKLPSLQLGVQCVSPISDPLFYYMSYRGPGQPMPNEQNPVAAYQRLFAGAVPAGGGQPNEATQRSIAAQLARRRSIIDNLTSEVAELSRALGATERQKLDQHLTALRGLEKLLEPNSSAAASANCGAPKLDAAGMMDWKANANFPWVTKAQTDLAVAALACDLTRVVTLQLSSGYGEVKPTWLGIDSAVHGVVHANMSSGNTPRRAIYEKWFAEQFAYLVARLKSVPEGGGTLLDNTLAVWMSSQGDGGGHRLDIYQAALAGRAGGYARPGFIRNYNSGGGREPHNRLLLTMCHAMGLTDIATVGEPSLCARGPLDRIMGTT